MVEKGGAFCEQNFGMVFCLEGLISECEEEVSFAQLLGNDS